MINLYVEPRIILTWDEFRQQKQQFSVALDGYISDKPLFDSSGPYANFNHHEFVDRLSTRSTAGQVHIAVKMGLFQTFQHRD